jgi:cytochrome c biogenesis protein CcdA
MRQTGSTDSSNTSWIIPTGAGILLLLMGTAGYFLYLHAGSILQRGQTLPPLLILALAVIGGAASFFSPCSIAITPAFLAYLTFGTPPSKDTRMVSRPVLVAAGLVALGIVAFYSAAGVIIGAVGSVAYNFLIYFIPVVALVFLLLGILILLGRGSVLAFVERWNPMNRLYELHETGTLVKNPARKRALISFGFAYGAASHTCSLPIFLGILLVPLVAGNYLLAAASVLVYGFAMAFLVVVMVALGHRVFAALRRSGPWLMRVTAVLFIATSAFLFYYFGQNYGAYLGKAAETSTASTVPGRLYRLTEGADVTGYPYQPRTLVIPARKAIRVAITDHIGGCLLRTVFEGLGPNGRAAGITVPVGQTGTVTLYARHPGRYAFHCGEDMYSGTAVAR